MSRNPNPFEVTIKKTERTGNQKLVEWMNQVIKEENLNFGQAEQETVGSDQKQPDVILFRAPRDERITLVLELKPPFFDPLDFEAVKEPARKKATQRRAPYFATSNFKTLYLFSTERANKFEEEERQIVGRYSLSQIEDLNLIEEPAFKNSIQKNLAIFLRELDDYVYKQKPERLLNIDQLLIYSLQEKVRALSGHYRRLIEERCLNDLGFRRNLKRWFNDQGWEFVSQPQ
ncbi:MAG: hypothetical protein ABID04_04410, partial [Patescibacteria group bacterium]